MSMLRPALAILLAATLAACGGQGEGACTPGDVTRCTCQDGREGLAACLEGGLGACVCEGGWDVGGVAGSLFPDQAAPDAADPDSPPPPDAGPDAAEPAPEAVAPDGNEPDEAEPAPDAAEPAPDVAEPAPEVVVPTDKDGDGVPDSQDNCVDLPNPTQADTDHDLSGDACDPDDDGDWVVDEEDEDPLDPAWPGLGQPATIYCHTSGELYAWNPLAMAEPAFVGFFQFPGDGYDHSMTDVALDVDGRLYGVTFDALYRCSAVSAQCRLLAALDGQFNGFTLVPKGVLDPSKEVLVAVGGSGTWNRVDLVGAGANVSQVGSYGGVYSSSGDAFSVTNMGTFASVNKDDEGYDWLVRVDPASGTVLDEIGEIAGYTSVFGLAGLYDTVYAFDASGAIVSLDVTTGATSLVVIGSKAWWGAGVSTRSLKGD